jgi:hypothetical protein
MAVNGLSLSFLNQLVLWLLSQSHIAAKRIFLAALQEGSQNSVQSNDFFAI